MGDIIFGILIIVFLFRAQIAELLAHTYTDIKKI